MKSVKTLFAIVIFPWLLSGVLAAQEPSSAHPPSPSVHDAGFGERVDVTEIQLEVMVTDRDGRPVDDLRPGDFRVTVGGDSARVLAADLVAAGSESVDLRERPAPSVPAREVTTEGTSRADFDDSLKLVLFVDLENVNPHNNGRMLAQVFAFLDAELRPGDQVLIATHDHGVRIRQPLTTDLSAVREVLTELIQERLGRMMVDPEELMLRRLRQLYDSGVPCNQLEPMTRSFADEEYRRSVRAIGGLQSLVESLVGLPGRKALLHVSDGLPLVAGMAGFEFLIEQCTAAGLARGVARSDGGGRAPRSELSLRNMDTSAFDTTNAWTELAARANRNHVTFYPLQAVGLRDHSFAGADQEARTLSAGAGMVIGWNRQDALVMTAKATGGTAILNRNRIAEALLDMEQDLRHYYRLSVRLDDQLPGVRTIEISVARDGADIRHRQSLHVQSRVDRVADRVLATTLHDAGENPWGLRARKSGSEKIDKHRRLVRLKLEIPLAALTFLPDESTEAGASRGLFTVFVAARDEMGGWTPVRRSTLRVDHDPTDPQAPERYVFEVEMEMRQGRHDVGFGVLDEVGGGTSFLRTEIQS